jgi:hypothetical protein
MNKLSALKLIVLTIILSFSFAVCGAQSYNKPPISKPGNGLPEKSSARKKTAVNRGPVSAEKAKKKAAAKVKKKKKDFVKYVKENQKRSIEIQTPEVQERMKQNVKDANTNYKDKKKRNASRSKSAGRKYR